MYSPYDPFLATSIAQAQAAAAVSGFTTAATHGGPPVADLRLQVCKKNSRFKSLHTASPRFAQNFYSALQTFARVVVPNWPLNNERIPEWADKGAVSHLGRILSFHVVKLIGVFLIIFCRTWRLPEVWASDLVSRA